MANLNLRPGIARTVKVLNQTGKKPNIRVDKARKALAPGKRISRKGKVYWETRRNRSDKIGKRI